ncbi:MAG: Holliday junction resolvase RuvX [Candidatus Cloacimonadaceae bacterium]|jgi:putative Holliday junction resolvase|nr:Holliday junction resolvase RuvX [Candidatus Cloacimonadota bacterium]MDY0127666.1 Holliday junction resolvase RuvX [Candidatus Cloacimonadaceae bacterium]MCB5254329.1 Holliday junction resolvase RuvX [Candidatus Cloacimonadota bacterium]MCK9178861.1 Holliday junction resolvase RuvX [Candidatus Cloacimonadota bacterium]MCK9242966.1 Holliday junction resolvase RuvX [Candidatus Cloacimonadota bacterium]
MTSRIMAIDYGTKRVGIAFSDPLGMFATPHSVLENSGFDVLLSQIKKLIKEQSVNLILVGMPYAIDGRFTPKTTETQDFMKKLQAALSTQVIAYDERYSSCEAEEELKKMGKTWQEARKMVDAMAATMILRSYLENQC